MIQLVHEPITPETVLQHVRSPRAGAVVLFLGTTRQFTGEKETASLDYECYGEMAIRTLEELAESARQKWPLESLAIVHRLGHLELEEASIAIAVSAPHRGDAFAAGQWLIDTIKEVVPIWKQENWADGSSQWVHPGTDCPTTTPPAADQKPPADTEKLT